MPLLLPLVLLPEPSNPSSLQPSCSYVCRAALSRLTLMLLPALMQRGKHGEALAATRAAAARDVAAARRRLRDLGNAGRPNRNPMQSLTLMRTLTRRCWPTCSVCPTRRAPRWSLCRRSLPYPYARPYAYAYAYAHS